MSSTFTPSPQNPRGGSNHEAIEVEMEVVPGAVGQESGFGPRCGMSVQYRSRRLLVPRKSDLPSHKKQGGYETPGGTLLGSLL